MENEFINSLSFSPQAQNNTIAEQNDLNSTLQNQLSPQQLQILTQLQRNGNPTNQTNVQLLQWQQQQQQNRQFLMNYQAQMMGNQMINPQIQMNQTKPAQMATSMGINMADQDFVPRVKEDQ